MYACLAVTCHLHFWQNDRDFLRATVVTRGWNGYRNKSQHRKSTLEKKLLPPFQQGFEPATFQSRVRCSNHWAIPAPQLLFRHTAVKHKGLVWPKTPPAMSEMTQERTARSVLPYHQLNNLMWIQLAFKLLKLNLLHTQLLFRTEAPHHHHHHLLTGVSPAMIGAQMTSKLRKPLSPAQIPSAQGRGAGATG